MRWAHSKATLADCLTKSMDSSELRRVLGNWACALFADQRNLEIRAGERQSLSRLANKKP